MSITDQSTAVTATSTGAVVTSGGTPNTQGAWTEVIASTSAETHWLQLLVLGSLADENYGIEIGVGPASSEVSLISEFPAFCNQLSMSPIVVAPMPATIPIGSRVSIRTRSTTASDALQFMLFLSDDSEFGTSTQNETVGFLPGSSKGTDIDPGGSANTKGSYVELSSSISFGYNYVVVMLGNSDNNSQTAGDFLVSVADGVAASEVDRILNTLFMSTALELGSSSQQFFQTFSSTSRMAANAQSTITEANDRLIDIAVIGFNIVVPAGGADLIIPKRQLFR